MGCQLDFSMCHSKNAIGEVGYRKTLPQKKLSALSLVSAVLKKTPKYGPDMGQKGRNYGTK